MITFNQYITELFQKHYDYKKHEDYINHHEAEFHTDNGNKYQVGIGHHITGSGKTKKHTAHIDFEAPESKISNNKMKINHQEGHSAVKVFSTVHHIIRDHLKQHPEISHIKFSASHKEPTRMKLYSHLAKHFAHNHTERGGKTSDKEFTIHRDDIKD